MWLSCIRSLLFCAQAGICTVISELSPNNRRFKVRNRNLNEHFPIWPSKITIGRVFSRLNVKDENQADELSFFTQKMKEIWIGRHLATKT
jgi:hypothetical protein